MQIGEKKKPELFRRAARSKQFWPVMANNESDWQKEALQRVSALELGADLQKFRVCFRKARGTDANLPARLWAKAAVRTIRRNTTPHPKFSIDNTGFWITSVIGEFLHGNRAGKSASNLNGCMRFQDSRSFHVNLLPGWKLAVRKIIREQMKLMPSSA